MKKTFNRLAALSLAFVFAFFVNALTGIPIVGIAGAIFALSFIPMPSGLAFMAITYPTDCDDADPVHSCSDCEDVELGRVRGIALIKVGYTIANPLLAADWITGINSGDIIIIPMTRGTFTPTPKTGPGYGDQATKYIGTDYEVKFVDPSYNSNRNFYNTIKRYQNYRLAYKTETLVHIADKACQLLPGAPVQDDINSEIAWEVTANWTSQNEPTAYLCPSGVFVCFDVE